MNKRVEVAPEFFSSLSVIVDEMIKSSPPALGEDELTAPLLVKEAEKRGTPISFQKAQRLIAKMVQSGKLVEVGRRTDPETKKICRAWRRV